MYGFRWLIREINLKVLQIIGDCEIEREVLIRANLKVFYMIDD